jgi:phosphatidylglycerol:prolipoprotein diacylglycerol transferase
MWILTLLVIYLFLLLRLKKGEGNYSKNFIEDLLLNGFIGALIGGRLGYVLFYNLSYFVAHPLEIISPYNFGTESWTGIYGMSFHGGAIGVIIALILTTKKEKKNYLEIFDFLMPVFPLGYFFGRLGNFFNGELVGRQTEKFWGVYFNGENFLRHPSQLYEAFGEGLFIFLILWFIRNKKLKKGVLSSLYLIFYAIIRFFIEFFRQPDEQLGFIFLKLTMGQILSLGMFLIGISLILYLVFPKFYRNTDLSCFKF